MREGVNTPEPGSGLTGAQLERQDIVDNAVFNLVKELIPDGHDRSKLEWDIEWIAEIRDIVEEILEEKVGVRPIVFYPYIGI